MTQQVLKSTVLVHLNEFKLFHDLIKPTKAFPPFAYSSSFKFMFVQIVMICHHVKRSALEDTSKKSQRGMWFSDFL
jgi:hypothetical protein